MIPIVFLLHPSFWSYMSGAFPNMNPYAQGMPQQPYYPAAGQPYMQPFSYPAAPPQPDKQQLLFMRQYLLDQLKQVEEALSAIDKAEKGKK